MVLRVLIVFRVLRVLMRSVRVLRVCSVYRVSNILRRNFPRFQSASCFSSPSQKQKRVLLAILLGRIRGTLEREPLLNPLLALLSRDLIQRVYIPKGPPNHIPYIPSLPRDLVCLRYLSPLWQVSSSGWTEPEHPFERVTGAERASAMHL